MKFFTCADLSTMWKNLTLLTDEQIADRYCHEYAYLYDHDDQIAGYDDAITDGDELFESGAVQYHIDRLCRAISDVIISDRERAALAFTFAAAIDETPDPITGVIWAL